VAALALLAGAGPAAADRLPFQSKISIAAVELGFQGRVRVPVFRPCSENRRVVLFRVLEGGPDEAMGHTRSGRRGAWRIPVSGFAGISLAEFYAKAFPARRSLAGLPILCDTASSRAIGLGR
jgi:hypothetical protein